MMTLVNLKPFFYWAGFIVFLLLEQKRQYRPASVAKLQRWLTNVPLSVINGVVYHMLFATLIFGIIEHSKLGGVGLLNNFALPSWVQIVLGILFLDFAIYIWHLLTHAVPLLWRFHRVHHSDMNMDVTTANRFHLGEFLVSGFVRLIVIYTFGISVLAYLLFEMLVNISIQFHHSSINVSPVFERFWMLLFVPPSLHRTHHSVKIKERDSNYGVILSVWDRIFGTLRTNVEQSSIIIGIGSHRKFAELGFWHMLFMPFTRKSK